MANNAQRLASAVGTSVDVPLAKENIQKPTRDLDGWGWEERFHPNHPNPECLAGRANGQNALVLFYGRINGCSNFILSRVCFWCITSLANALEKTMLPSSMCMRKSHINPPSPRSGGFYDLSLALSISYSLSTTNSSVHTASSLDNDKICRPSETHFMRDERVTCRQPTANWQTRR
jgi:hypothetical protein